MTSQAQAIEPMARVQGCFPRLPAPSGGQARCSSAPIISNVDVPMLFVSETAMSSS